MMADVYTVTFTLIGILLSVPAVLVALNLLLPRVTERSYRRLQQTPGRCFFLGVPVTAAFLLIIAIAANVPGPGQGAAFVIGSLGMGMGTLGAAGLARLLGERIAAQAHPNSDLVHLVRGAIVYELACLTPIVGWFLFAPLIGITVIGAAVFALLGWAPKPVTAPVPQTEAGQMV